LISFWGKAFQVRMIATTIHLISSVTLIDAQIWWQKYTLVPWVIFIVFEKIKNSFTIFWFFPFLPYFSFFEININLIPPYRVDTIEGYVLLFNTIYLYFFSSDFLIFIFQKMEIEKWEKKKFKKILTSQLISILLL